MKNIYIFGLIIVGFFFIPGYLSAQYCIDFDNPVWYDSIISIDTASVNIWQTGQPQKMNFDSAKSFPKALVTDTVNFYPKDNNSLFNINLTEIGKVCGFGISFYHKYDTDSLKDGGMIQISYDSMNANWVNIINDTNLIISNGLYSNLYSVETLGDVGFSGLQLTWQKTALVWKSIPSSVSNNVQLRFLFKSDSIQNNKDGWIIDDLCMQDILCPGIEKNNYNENINVYPNPVSDVLFIELTDGSNFDYTLWNSFGEIVIFSKKESEKRKHLNLDQLKSGIYFLTIRNNKNNLTRKIIVQ